jgi:hypothetical protein
MAEDLRLSDNRVPLPDVFSVRDCGQLGLAVTVWWRDEVRAPRPSQTKETPRLVVTSKARRRLQVFR